MPAPSSNYCTIHVYYIHLLFFRANRGLGFRENIVVYSVILARILGAEVLDTVIAEGYVVVVDLLVISE